MTIPDSVAAPPAVAVDLTLLVEPMKEKHPKIFLFRTDSPWLKRINYFGKSFALVNALIITIVISIVTMIILLMVIL